MDDQPEVEYFKTGDYYVSVREMLVPVTNMEVTTRRSFVVVHRPSGVVAGISATLPDAIRGAVVVDRETRIVSADPYDVAANTSSARAQ